MFNFKTRKQLKEEMESLEKQLEYAEGIVRDVQKENMKLKDEKAELGFRNSKQSKLIKEGRKENKKLKEKIHMQLLAYESLEHLEQELEAKVGRYKRELKEAKQCNETYSESFRQLKDKLSFMKGTENQLEHARGIVIDREEVIEGLREELRELRALYCNREEERDYWRNELNKQWVGRQKTAINLNIARRQLKREQELRGIDQGRATQEKIELKLDLKKTKETNYNLLVMESRAAHYLEYKLGSANKEVEELKREKKRLEEENKKWGKWELRTVRNAVEEATEELKNELKEANHKVNKLEYFNVRTEDRLLDEIKALEREKYELKKRLENILTNKDNKVIKSYAVIPKQNNEVVGIVRK